MIGGRGRHLYDSISEQKSTVVDSFADQRESLKRAVAEQRLAAMPEDMRRATLGPTGQVSQEIVDTLRKIIAGEVTRQLDMAVCAMIERAERAGAATEGESSRP